MGNKTGVRHNHSATSNTRDCFRQFIGHRVIGLLFDALPAGRRDLAAGGQTIIFDCGYGLTIASNGSYWVECPNEIERGIKSKKDELDQTKREITEVLSLTGE